MEQKNYMKEVASLLGVELEEEFKIEMQEGVLLSDNIYKITKTGLYMLDKHQQLTDVSSKLTGLLNGTLKIIKIPYKPKYGEVYYTLYGDRTYYTTGFLTWCNSDVDYMNYYLGMCFRNKDEAIANNNHRFETYKNYYKEN